MKVTVGIPHYRSIAGLQRVLRGLNDQELNHLQWKNIEVIVSNDEDFDIKNQFNIPYKYKINFLYGKNGGPAIARNRVINIANGNYVLFLDSDSIPDVDWIEQMCLSLGHKNVYAVGGAVIGLKGEGLVNEWFNTKNYLNTPIVCYKTNKVVSLITANCGFKVELLRDLNGFDELVFGGCNPGGEDVDLSYRIRKLGYNLDVNLNAKTYHIFPSDFSYIVSKARNYAVGIKTYIKARDIKPKDIRQPEFNFLGMCRYFFYRQSRIFDFWINKELVLWKRVMFVYYEQVFLINYMIGYYKFK